MSTQIAAPSGLIIHVMVKSVYGEDKIYPACDKASVFAEIAGTKTLTERAIAQIRQLGYTVQVVHQIVNV